MVLQTASLLGVELVLEVAQKFLDVVDCRALGNVRDHQGSFEQQLPVLVHLASDDSPLNQVNDLGGQDVGHSATLFPGNVGDLRGSALFAVSAHFELEVLVDVHLKEVSALTSKVEEAPLSLLEHHVSQIGFHLVRELGVLDCELKSFIWIVLDLKTELILVEVLC